MSLQQIIDLLTEVWRYSVLVGLLMSALGACTVPLCTYSGREWVRDLPVYVAISGAVLAWIPGAVLMLILFPMVIVSA